MLVDGADIIGLHSYPSTTAGRPTHALFRTGRGLFSLLGLRVIVYSQLRP